MTKKNTHQKGYVMLATTISFILLSLVIVGGLVLPIIKQRSVGNDVWGAKQSYFLSEAGAEDVMYRLKNSAFSGSVGSLETLNLNGFFATTTVSGSISSLDGATILTTSDINGYRKLIQTKVRKGDGVSFFYAMQVGQGGFSITGSSRVIGNVFSAGDVVICDSCSVSGSAIVARDADVFVQENSSPASPTQSTNFNNTAAQQDIAQSFRVATTSPLRQAAFFVKRFNWPSQNVTAKVVTDSSGSPSTNVLASVNLSFNQFPTTDYDWVVAIFPTNPTLTAGTTYWIVFDVEGTGSASAYYTAATNLDSQYVQGTAKKGALGGSWTTTGLDLYFKVFTGDPIPTLRGLGEWNKGKVGTNSGLAWAYNILYIDVTGEARCFGGVLNTKACMTTYGLPTPADMPISDELMDSWKAEATAGGVTNGSYIKTDSGTVTLGPRKIVGDLIIGGSVTLNLTGTIYVTGRVSIEGSGKIYLASSYGSNSGVIISDGRIAVGNSGQAGGSGQSGSYLMLVSKSSCPSGAGCNGEPAIKVDGGSGAIILNAQNGTVILAGSAKANEITANRIEMSGSTVVTYQSGLTNPNFSSGPSGSFNINGWRELTD